MPAALRDLAARQQGDAVVLTFTLPRDSSAQKPLAETPAVDIYRGTPPAGSGVPAVANAAPSAAAPSSSPQSPGPPSKNSPAAASSPALRLIHTIPGDTVNTYEHDGKVEFRDALDPADLARLPGESLAYQVRTRVTANHASAPSNSVTLQVYPAPQAVLGMQAMVTEQAILLSWTPPASTTGANSAKIVGYHVYRGEIDPGSAAAGEASATKPIFRVPLALLAESAGPAYRDERFEFGRTYFYIVRSVAQWNTVAVESADPQPAIVTATDVFPPAAPQQLEIVVTPATPEAGSSIELAWAISPEPDLEGYEVYRSEQPDTVGERLNSELLPAPTFRDMTVAPAHQYFYRIRAVDRAGNESAFSAAVAARIPGAGP